MTNRMEDRMLIMVWGIEYAYLIVGPAALVPKAAESRQSRDQFGQLVISAV